MEHQTWNGGGGPTEQAIAPSLISTFITGKKNNDKIIFSFIAK